MNREILFRGKRVDNGEYVYGYVFPVVINEIERWFIIPCDTLCPKNITIGELQVEVKKETVSQFTGLLDKNGNKIFEGDLIKKSGIINGTRYYTRGYRGKTEHPSNYKLEGYGLFEVHLNLITGVNYQLIESDHNQRLLPHSVFFGYQTKPLFSAIDGEIEIIGNIHENK